MQKRLRVRWNNPVRSERRTLMRGKKGNEILQTIVVIALLGAVAITVCVLISSKLKLKQPLNFPIKIIKRLPNQNKGTIFFLSSLRHINLLSCKTSQSAIDFYSLLLQLLLN